MMLAWATSSHPIVAQKIPLYPLPNVRLLSESVPMRYAHSFQLPIVKNFLKCAQRAKIPD
jgi:hypothetical protein